MSGIVENVAAVRAGIAAACEKAGRDPSDVLLLGVTKYVDTERIGEALDAGITAVGENHAQELREKLTFFEQRKCDVHFIGQLQTNKIKYVCGSARLIHSVDRLPLAEQISARAARLGITQEILLQVNIGAESQKGGISRDETLSLLESVAALPALCIEGLMCVPPAMEEERVRPYFAAMRELLFAAKNAFPELPLSTLSMGMSHDYRTAVEEGATIVRVGSAIFGARDRL